MPWVIDYRYDDSLDEFNDGFVNPEWIRIEGHEEELRTRHKLFPVRPDGYHWLQRSVYEYGRAYYQLKEDYEKLPTRATAGLYCDRFKRLLEELEPGKHEFAQADLRMPDGTTPWHEPYWHWHCGNLISAIVPDIGDNDPDRSESFFWDTEKEYLIDSTGHFLGSGPPCLPYKPVLNQEAICENYAWLESQFLFNSRDWKFLSDEFVEQLDRLDAVLGLHLGYVETSDLPVAKVRSVTGDRDAN